MLVTIKRDPTPMVQWTREGTAAKGRCSRPDRKISLFICGSSVQGRYKMGCVSIFGMGRKKASSVRGENSSELSIPPHATEHLPVYHVGGDDCCSLTTTMKGEGRGVIIIIIMHDRRRLSRAEPSPSRRRLHYRNRFHLPLPLLRYLPFSFSPWSRDQKEGRRVMSDYEGWRWNPSLPATFRIQYNLIHMQCFHTCYK